MARPVYPYELDDPDLSWLITNFQENFPEYILVESSALPLVFIGGKAESVQQTCLPELKEIAGQHPTAPPVIGEPTSRK